MCGVIAIYNYQDSNIIIIELLESLKKLQNRGRDSYGILLSNKDRNIIIKESELITIENIKERNLHNINFNLALGHSRYSTSYDSIESKNNVEKSHPFEGVNINLGIFHLVHNGNINFNSEIKKQYHGLNDTQILVKIIEQINKFTWKDIISEIIRNIPGIYNVIISSNGDLYGFKDRFNMRPLCVGKNEFGFCLASESNALGNYSYIREIKGGQMVEISHMGIRNFNVLENQNRVCLFEFIYFLNPKSKFNDKEVFGLRHSLGYELGRNESQHIDSNNKSDIVVIGSPDTGIPSGIGFAESLDLKYEQFLEKNKNRGRSFILADDSSRAEECKKKFLVNPDFSISDKIVFFVDDSIVRGNTTKRIINLLKEYGAREIHIRISSPKIIDICKFGIDIPTKDELIMNRMDERGFEKENEIESLRYLDLDSMQRVIGKGLNINKNNFCIGCFSGNYEKQLLDW